MNKHAAHPDPAGDHTDERPSLMYFGKRRVQPAAAYAILGVLAVAFLLVIGNLGIDSRDSLLIQPLELPENNSAATTPPFNKTGPTAKLIERLKQYGLWTLSPLNRVPRFFIEAYPDDLNTVQDISLKKKIFLHSLLPHALLVRQEALQKRQKYESILQRIDCDVQRLDFDSDFNYETQCFWTKNLEGDEISFVRKLCDDYRTTSAETLLERVDAVPVSLILAQGALESYWGSSRFTREGNSIFGMWTWKTPGMVPARRDEGKTHKVKTYEDILASVRAYQLTLNRLEPYEEFRKLRRLTDDPLIMAEGLDLYAERGQDYIEDIKKVILHNDLQKYDRCLLQDSPSTEFAESFLNAADRAVTGKTSL